MHIQSSQSELSTAGVAALLLLSITLAGCATPHRPIEDRRLTGKPITNSAEWEACARDACVSRNIGNGRCPSFEYSEPWTYHCGWKPDPTMMTTEMQEKIAKECQPKYDYSKDLIVDSFVRVLPYAPNGAFMKDIKDRCARVFDEVKAQRAAEEEATQEAMDPDSGLWRCLLGNGRDCYEKYARKIRTRQEQYLAANPKTSAGMRDAILNGKVKMGMSREEVVAAWGKPKDINSTVGSWGTHEQWVYEKQYLYFSNGKVTSWQD